MKKKHIQTQTQYINTFDSINFDYFKNRYVNGTDLMRLHLRLATLYENSVCRKLGPVLVDLIDAFVSSESDRKKDLGDILFLDFEQNVDLSAKTYGF